MNKFLVNTKKHISRHGVLVDFVQVQEGTYDVETSSVTNTETITQIKAYPVAVQVTQYNFPNLVGKEVIKFLLAGDALAVKPSPMDKIIYKGGSYSVVEQQDYTALGEVCLQHLIACKA